MESPTIKYPANGTAYKLLNGVLMFAPLNNDNEVIEAFGEEDWSKVDFDRLSTVDSIYPKQALITLTSTMELNDYLLK
jgi:hypothetical protein